MDTQTASPDPAPKPKRSTVVNAILGMWLHKTNPDLTPEEQTRARVECRKRLDEAREKCGSKTPPIDALLLIDEAVALHILAHREKLQALYRTSPLRQFDPAPEENGSAAPDNGQDKDGTTVQTNNKPKPAKPAAPRARTSELDNLFKVIEQSRKVRKDIEEEMKPGKKAPKDNYGISPQVQAMIRDSDEVMKELLAMGARRNAEYDGPPNIAAPFYHPEPKETDQ